MVHHGVTAFYTFLSITYLFTDGSLKVKADHGWERRWWSESEKLNRTTHRLKRYCGHDCFGVQRWQTVVLRALYFLFCDS